MANPVASPRCSYIPPEGQSVIAVATQRGGTTDGDIQALRDRFGCKAEATYEMTAEEDSDREQFSCIDHVGHLCGDGYWLVQPVYVPSDVAITIVRTDGVAREGFGSPMVLAPLPVATPIVDLVDFGTNPTRKQLGAHGYDPDTTEYREALDGIRRLSEAPDARSRIEASKLAYGTGFGRRHPDGRLEHIPTPEMIVDRMPTPRTEWGEAIAERVPYRGEDVAGMVGCLAPAAGPSRNDAGVIVDRAFCEPYERMGSYLVTAWRCHRCNRDAFSYALASAVIQPSTCCGAPAEQIRLADAGTFTET